VSKIYRALERAESERTGDRSVNPRSSASVLEPEAEHHVPLPGRREEYEKLKVMLTLEAKRNELRSVMLISALAGEGVTTVALGLAGTMAEVARHGVLVVDLNPANPALDEHLGVHPERGLAEVLTKEVAVQDAIVATPIPRLSVLAAGHLPTDFSQADTLAQLEEMVKGLRTDFDFVIVDGGSLETTPDNLLAASRMDGVVLVVQAERTGADTVREASGDLRAAGARLLGAVLNRRRDYLPGFLSRRI
jgi:capsular exopolysaccharide synthesis family protein